MKARRMGRMGLGTRKIANNRLNRRKVSNLNSKSEK